MPALAGSGADNSTDVVYYSKGGDTAGGGKGGGGGVMNGKQSPSLEAKTASMHRALVAAGQRALRSTGSGRRS